MVYGNSALSECGLIHFSCSDFSAWYASLNVPDAELSALSHGHLISFIRERIIKTTIPAHNRMTIVKTSSFPENCQPRPYLYWLAAPLSFCGSPLFTALCGINICEVFPALFPRTHKWRIQISDTLHVFVCHELVLSYAKISGYTLLRAFWEAYQLPFHLIRDGRTDFYVFTDKIMHSRKPVYAGHNVQRQVRFDLHIDRQSYWQLCPTAYK